MSTETNSNLREYIPLIECKKGYLYRINSRNLSFGVYDGKGGFIGIREKFGGHYLFTEFHWDQGPPYGTVRPVQEIEKIPENIEVKEGLGTVDSATNRQIHWEDEKESWVYDDTNETFSPMTGKRKGFACGVSNDVLFEYLKKVEQI